jgi:hypothetical protein
MKILRFLLLSQLLSDLVLADLREDKALVLVQHLNNSEDVAVAAMPSQSDIEVWKGEARELDPDVALPALIKLWVVGGQQDFIVLEWWRKRENAEDARMLIVALFECASREPTSAKPPFKAFARRFLNMEQQARLSEIDIVTNNRKLIAKALVTSIERTKSKIISKEACDFLIRYRKTANENDSGSVP